MEVRFEVRGMTCAACAARVERVSSQVNGVSNVEVNLLRGTMRLVAQSEDCVPLVIKAVQDAGYQANLSGEKTQVQQPVDQNLVEKRNRLVGSIVFLAVLMYFTMGHMIGLPIPGWYHGVNNAAVAALLQLFLTAPVVYMNRGYYSRGFKALWHRSPNMDTLIAVGSASALIYGIFALFRMSWALGHGQWDVVEQYSTNLYFESAAMILTLISLGKFLETRAKRKTGDAIRRLMDLSPRTATVRRNGEEITVPAEQVAVGDLVVVRSGSAIPVDGVLVEGRGTVDQSAMTGESVPVEKSVGEQVTAGTVNTEGFFVFRAEKVGEDTALSQIIRLVEDAGGSKAPIARLADKIAGIFVPVVMAVAVVSFAVWMLAGMGVEFSLNIGISVLVISCPCALGLATPVAIMVGTGRAAGMGILFRNAEALENLHRVDTVVLDKTGTITVGKPQVTDVCPGDQGLDMLLRVASSLESKSEHPFSKAIMEYTEGVQRFEVTDFKTMPGQGVSGIIDGIRYYGGNQKLMKSLGIPVPEQTDWKIQGKTPLYFASEDKAYLGSIAAADVLRPDAAAAVTALRELGLDVVMLTGDNAETASAVAAQAGINRVISDVLPGDKAGAVARLQAQGHRVLMVGDGINDAPALVTADVGMAVGAGTDIAIDSADVVLMNNALRTICGAVSLSRATMRNIRQNLFWAFFYNSLGIPIAAGVLYPAFGLLLSPMLGAAAMSFSSVFVVSNALRLRLFKPRFSSQEEPLYIEPETTKEEKIMEKIIHVNGMMCPHCQARVEQVCKSVAGVTDAVVDLQLKQVTLSGIFEIGVVHKAITDAGYEVVE